MKDKTQSSSKLARVIISAIISFLFALLVLQYLYISSGGSPPKSVSESLLQSLQASSIIYMKQQGVPPEVFSDYVVSSGLPKGEYTLTLVNLTDGKNPQVIKVEDIETTKMKLSFVGDIEATYYLSGTEVTGLFVDPNKVETAPDDTIHQGRIIIGCVLFILSFFIFYSLSGLLSLIRFIICVLIFILLAVIAIPKYSNLTINLYPEASTEVNIKLDKTIKVGIDIPTCYTQRLIRKGFNPGANYGTGSLRLTPRFDWFR